MRPRQMNAVCRDRMVGRGLEEEHRILITHDERRMHALGQVVIVDRRGRHSGPKVRTQQTEDMKTQRAEGEDAAARSSGEERGESRARSARTSRNLVILAKGSASVYAKTEKTHMRGLARLAWKSRKTRMGSLRRLTGGRIL